jgi:hypothetical protein
VCCTATWVTRLGWEFRRLEAVLWLAGAHTTALARIIHEVSTAAADLYAISALFAARHPRRTVEYASGGSLLR